VRQVKRYNLGPVKPDCTFDGCTNPQYGYGLCEGHNQQRRRGSELKPLRSRMKGKVCARCGDGTPAYVSSSGEPLCRKHHARWVRHGDSVKLSRNGVRPMAEKIIKDAVANRDRSVCWLDWAELPCWEAFDGGGGTVTRGYPTVGRTKVMWMVMEADGRPRPPAPANHGLHGCDNSACWNPDHLRWGTHEQNMTDLQAVRNYCAHCPHCNP
jgi:hypothetical protein